MEKILQVLDDIIKEENINRQIKESIKSKGLDGQTVEMILAALGVTSEFLFCAR